MLKSSKPLALSVATITEPGDVELTVQRIMEFDGRPFGFNHDRTWAAMPWALRGVFDPRSVEASLYDVHPRVRACIVALCKFGKSLPMETRAFKDFTQSGLSSVRAIDWDPSVSIRVKATCWHVADGVARIPLLQPRKDAISDVRLAVYLELARMAYCVDDWSDAQIDLIDLSSVGKDCTASLIDLQLLPKITEREVREFVETFVQAKNIADKMKSKKEKKKIIHPMESLFEM